MENLGFWAVAALLAFGVAGLLVASLMAARGRLVPEEGAGDLKIYRDQLAEVERDLAKGTLAAAEAERLRTEIARRLLEADRLAKSATKAVSNRSILVPSLLIIAAFGAAFALYARLGAVGYDDLPLSQRLAMSQNYLDDRLSQTAFMERIGRPRDAARAAELDAEMAQETDAAALRQTFGSRARTEDFLASIKQMERVIALAGDQATAGDYTGLAFSLFLEADTYVSPEAEAALKKALEIDPKNEAALYLMGELYSQAGRFDLTFNLWRPLAENGRQDVPWFATVRDNITTIARLAGIPYTPNNVVRDVLGPSADDIDAAGDLSIEERQQMIDGMVMQLSDRLSSQGGSAQEWAQLIRALGVLGRYDEAQAIWLEAKNNFNARPEDVAIIEAAAKEAGVAP